MGAAATERPDDRYRDLDLWAAVDVAVEVAAVQREALRAVEAAAGPLAAATEALADRLRRGGRMAYAGAGSSGLIAQLDALELPGTYGLAPDRVPVILAGGTATLFSLANAAEDDAEAAAAAVDALALGPDDAIVALAASGSTPFTVAALRRAKARGAVTVGISCAPEGSLLEADFPVLIATPPEVVAGSTRMAAGTAQKCALNIISTGVAARLGHAYRGLMVNMSPDNAKLKRRAVAVVAKAAGVDEAAATRGLAAADWSIKVAVVLCLAGVDAAEARAMLRRGGGDIRAALRSAAAA